MGLGARPRCPHRSKEHLREPVRDAGGWRPRHRLRLLRDILKAQAVDPEDAPITQGQGARLPLLPSEMPRVVDPRGNGCVTQRRW